MTSPHTVGKKQKRTATPRIRTLGLEISGTYERYYRAQTFKEGFDTLTQNRFQPFFSAIAGRYEVNMWQKSRRPFDRLSR